MRSLRFPVLLVGVLFVAPALWVHKDKFGDHGYLASLAAPYVALLTGSLKCLYFCILSKGMYWYTCETSYQCWYFIYYLIIRAGVFSSILEHVLVYSGLKFETVAQDSGH